MGPALESQCFGGVDSGYLGPEHAGVVLKVDPANPLPYARPERDVSTAEAAVKADVLSRLNHLAAVEYPDDPKLRARIQSYELAFRMQTAVPEVLQFDAESEHIRRLYGLDHDVTRPFGQQLLAARRLAERGVRFIQIFHGDGAAGSWDAHAGPSRQPHQPLCPGRQADRRITDRSETARLARRHDRGLGDRVRPDALRQGADGRDHHNYGFSVWMAGGGIKGGIVHGATDELGFHAVENRHYVTDIHATVLHLLGLDSHRLEIPGRKRLEIEHGKVIRDIM